MRRLISILLQNEAGALARVAGLFAARGYNIDSLTVAATHDAAVSRLTLVTVGDDAVIDQIVKQSRKLVDVIEIEDLTGGSAIESELLIVRVHVADAALAGFVACLRRHPRAYVVEIVAGVRTVEYAGSGAEVDEFLAELTRVSPPVEFARSGTAALPRGSAPRFESLAAALST
ncbi:acetolactate synthase small subunit [Dokdonella ginsengisoli]|uniref:Acetolactate synthase small subunit n=1 Tax=Dokdonella ginsengisoli TaxID=363846 RepID=A0ABV9QT93_9GAMM